MSSRKYIRIGYCGYCFGCLHRLPPDIILFNIICIGGYMVYFVIGRIIPNDCKL